MITIIILSFFHIQSQSEPRPKLNLYQIGNKGRYCVSTTPDERGCISGANADGDPVNVLDLYSGYDLVFSNLSDVIHDMKTEGNNAQAGVQEPNGPESVLKMDQPDSEKRAVTCSLHGKQLGFGYTVSDKVVGSEGDGHRLRDSSDGRPLGTNEQISPSELLALGTGITGLNIKPTQLFDVAEYILKSGTPFEKNRLLEERPELRSLSFNESASKGGEPNQFPKLVRTGLNYNGNSKTSKALTPYNSSENEEDELLNLNTLAANKSLSKNLNNQKSGTRAVLTMPPGTGILMMGTVDNPFFIIVAAQNAVGFQGQLGELSENGPVQETPPSLSKIQLPKEGEVQSGVQRGLAEVTTPYHLTAGHLFVLLSGLIIYLASRKRLSRVRVPLFAKKEERVRKV